MKVFRVDYTVPEQDPDRVMSIFTRAENMTLAKHKISNLPYCGWVIKKIEQDTEKNYEKWMKWEYEPNYPEKKARQLL